MVEPIAPAMLHETKGDIDEVIVETQEEKSEVEKGNEVHVESEVKQIDETEDSEELEPISPDRDEEVQVFSRPKRTCVLSKKGGGGGDPDDGDDGDDESDQAVHSEYSTDSDLPYTVRDDYWTPFNVSSLASDLRKLKSFKKLCFNCVTHCSVFF